MLSRQGRQLSLLIRDSNCDLVSWMWVHPLGPQLKIDPKFSGIVILIPPNGRKIHKYNLSLLYNYYFSPLFLDLSYFLIISY
jgi:hypothetical protein